MFEQWLEEARMVAFPAVIHMCGNRPDREDLADEAASQAILEVVRLGEAHFESKNHVIRSVVTRAQWRFLDEIQWRQQHSGGEIENTEATGRSVYGWRALDESLRRSLDALGPRCRQILERYYIDGFSDMEIANAIAGRDANDADRQRVRTERLRCLSELRRDWYDNGIDPSEWW